MLNKEMIGYESQAKKPVGCFYTAVFSYKQHSFTFSNIGPNSSRIVDMLVYL